MVLVAVCCCCVRVVLLVAGVVVVFAAAGVFHVSIVVAIVLAVVRTVVWWWWWWWWSWNWLFAAGSAIAVLVGVVGAVMAVVVTVGAVVVGTWCGHCWWQCGMSLCAPFLCFMVSLSRCSVFVITVCIVVDGVVFVWYVFVCAVCVLDVVVCHNCPQRCHRPFVCTN